MKSEGMDVFSRIFDWLSDHEAGISAVAAIIVIGGVVLAGLRLLVRRREDTALAMAPIASAESGSAADSLAPDLDPLTVPGFEGRPAIAVLPFDNLSGDPDQEYFADGIAEDLITRLSAWRDFPVIARNSSFTYKGKPVDVKQVSRELGVRYVVEGSVRKAGDRVRISAQLIDAATGAHVWAEIYERKLQDIFALQDDIAEAVVASVYPELIRSEQQRAARKEPQNLDAWDCVVRGQWHGLKFTKEDNTKARSFCQEAAELDPAFAAAFAWLAMTYMWEVAFGWTDSRTRSIAEAIRLAGRSLELDERDPVAYVALAHASGLAGNRQQMVAARDRAMELNPNNARSHGELGFDSSYTGRPDAAIEHLERAMRLSPKDHLSFMWLTGMGFAHFAKGRFEEAASWLERSRQSRPDWHVTHRALAATYAELGRREEATTALEEDLRLAPNESISFIKEQIPYADPAFLEPYLDALRKAGMPE
jgi:TolB-like protein/Flp pilus assembly protein TadD